MREALITVKLKSIKKHLLDIRYFQPPKLTAHRSHLHVTKPLYRSTYKVYNEIKI